MTIQQRRETGLMCLAFVAAVVLSFAVDWPWLVRVAAVLVPALVVIAILAKRESAKQRDVGSNR